MKNDNELILHSSGTVGNEKLFEVPIGTVL